MALRRLGQSFQHGWVATNNGAEGPPAACLGAWETGTGAGPGEGGRHSAVRSFSPEVASLSLRLILHRMSSQMLVLGKVPCRKTVVSGGGMTASQRQF